MGRFDKIFFIINSLNFGSYFYLAHHWIQILIPKLRICNWAFFRQKQSDLKIQENIRFVLTELVVGSSEKDSCFEVFYFLKGRKKGFWFVFVNFKFT